MTLSIQKLLRGVIGPESNYLLTDRPGDGDFGWFCREHALITVFFCGAHGLDPRIVRGQISLFDPPFRLTTTSTSVEDYHWWVTSASTPLIDLSVSTAFHPTRNKLPEPVLQPGHNGAFTVRSPVSKDKHFAHCGAPCILYSPEVTLPHTAADLAFDPCLILPTIESAQIAARICIHIAGILTGKRRSYIGCRTQPSALKQLREAFPDAISHLPKLLSQAPQWCEQSADP